MELIWKFSGFSVISVFTWSICSTPTSLQTTNFHYPSSSIITAKLTLTNDSRLAYSSLDRTDAMAHYARQDTLAYIYEMMKMDLKKV